MTEPQSEGLSLEGDLADLVAEHEPEPAPEPEALLVPDTEPPADGTVEVSGTKINIGPIVAAERRRVEAKIRAEYEPLKQQASDVNTLRAELAALKAQLTPPKVEPAAPDVTDAEAETHARRHQLYGADGALDLKTSKSILSESKAEQRRIREEARADAIAAAKAELAPVQQKEATRAAHDNFMRIAATKDADGQFVFEDKATHPILLEEWNALPDNLRALPEVGEVVVDRALGRIARTMKRTVKAPVVEREPVLSEATGNRGFIAYTMSNVEKKVADAAKISGKDWETQAKKYVPGQAVHSLED